jgi:hypothetical protein
MSGESPQTVTISPCPNCDTSGGHVYEVPVKRDFIMATMSKPLEFVDRTFRITFTCPVNAKPFAATLRLRESPLDLIRSIGRPEVKPAIKEEAGE